MLEGLLDEIVASLPGLLDVTVECMLEGLLDETVISLLELPVAVPKRLLEVAGTAEEVLNSLLEAPPGYELVE